jgi:hypothetical protein
MAIKTKADRFTDAQQKEIVGRLNEAYDNGSSDCLKILIETVINIKEENNGNDAIVEMMDVFLHIIEAVRQQLYEVVSEPKPEESRLILPA